LDYDATSTGNGGAGVANFFTRLFKKTFLGRAKKAAFGAAAAAATAGIARLLGLDGSRVGKVLSLGVSMMTLVGAKDEGISGKLFANSKQKRKRSTSKGDAERDFFDVFGAMGRQMSSIISRETGATEDEVGGILGMFLPDFEQVIAEQDPEDEKALQRMFDRDAEEAKQDDPLFARLAKEIVF
jgi:hypothetical protein